MIDCKNLIIEDITPWHGDVFDHPIYEYSCKLSKKKNHTSHSLQL